MTRGRIAIITQDLDVYISTEFNGGMYYGRPGEKTHGKEITAGLAKVKSLHGSLHDIGFVKMVKKFNQDHFGYDCEESGIVFSVLDTYPEALSKSKTRRGSELIDFEMNKHPIWSADYLYLKNLAEGRVMLRSSDGEIIYLRHNEIMVLNFGNPLPFRDYSIR